MQPDTTGYSPITLAQRGLAQSAAAAGLVHNPGSEQVAAHVRCMLSDIF